MKKTVTILACSILTLISTHLFSQSGIDVSFANNGKLSRSVGTGFDYATATAVQPNGKILVAGYANTGGNNNMIMIRYNSNGSMDTAFGDSGTVSHDFGGTELAMAMLLLPDGKIILAGQANIGSGTDFIVARYNSNGSLDATFGNAGRTIAGVGIYDDIAQAVTLQKDGRIVLAGYTGAYPNYDYGVMRFLANGRIDSSFSSDGRVVMPIGVGMDIATAVRVQASGKIVVAGRFVRSGGYDIGLVRFKANGDLDLSFGSSGITMTTIGSVDDIANALEILPNQKILVGGAANTGSFNDFAVVRYDSSGIPDNSFSGDGKQTIAIGTENDYGSAMLVMPDGRIILGGSAKVNLYNQFALVRLLPDGRPDSTFGTFGRATFSIGNNNDLILAMAAQTDGKIVLAGVTHNGADYDFALARYIPGNSIGINMLEVASPVKMKLYPNPAADLVNLVYELQQPGNVSITLYGLDGRLIKSYPELTVRQQGQQHQCIELPEGLQPGLYMVRLTTPDGVGTVRMVIGN